MGEPMKILTPEQVFDLLDPDFKPKAQATMQKWLDRGDGIAVYQQQDFGRSTLGHRKYVSFGSPAAQLEGDTPPAMLPDIGYDINQGYCLEGVCRPSKDAPNSKEVK